MPFQQVSLDQSIYKKPKPQVEQKSPVSQALRPQGGKQYKGPIVNPSQGWTGLPGFSDEAKGIYEQNSFVDKQKAEWAAQDKATKQQREQQSSQLQNIGMQTVQQQQQKKQQVQQQQAQQQQQIESNPEPAAKEMYELMKTLPDEAKTQLLNQIFTPTSTGGSISSGGKEVKMGAKYNPIAGVFLEKGWAMFDPKGNVNLSEPEPIAEKGTYTQNANGDVLNTATGEVVLNKGDIPEGINPTQILDVIKEARAYTTGLVDPSMIEGLTPEGRSTFFDRADKKFKEHVSWILQNTYSMTLEQATKIANGMPKEDTIGAPTGGGTTTDPTIVGDLTKLFKENPNEVSNRKAYEDKYGAENVATALGETKITKATPKKEPYKPALPLEDLKTEDIIGELKRGLSNAKDIPSPKWAELSKSIDDWLKKIVNKKIFVK